MKSEVARDSATSNNPAMNITSMTEYVCSETEHIFNDEFWSTVDFCVNAVDNIKAR